jgi:phasin family protein
MVQITEQLTALSKSQLEAALKIAELTGENFEKLADVQLKAAKTAYEDAAKSLRQIASIKDVSEIATLSSGAAQPAWDKASAYARSLYEVLSAGQSEFAGVLEEQVAEFNKNLAVTLDAVIKSAPAGSEGALAGVKAAIQSANGVYETLVKAARQVAAVTEANLAAATSQPAGPSRKKAAA